MNKTIDWNNKDQVLEQVKKEGTFLRKASKELKKDMDIIKAAILNTRYAFTKIDAEFLHILKQNKPLNSTLPSLAILCQIGTELWQN